MLNLPNTIHHVLWSSPRSFCELFDAAAIPRLLLRGEELSASLFHLLIIIEAPPAQEMSHRPEQVVIRWRKVRTVSCLGQEVDS